MKNINERNETAKLLLKNSPSKFIIGTPLLSYPVKIIQFKEEAPEQKELEKECISYLVKVYDGVSFTVYENLSYGGYIITDVTFDRNIITLTYTSTRTTFTVHNETFVFDNFIGLARVIWNFKSLTKRAI